MHHTAIADVIPNSIRFPYNVCGKVLTPYTALGVNGSRVHHNRPIVKRPLATSLPTVLSNSEPDNEEFMEGKNTLENTFYSVNSEYVIDKVCEFYEECIK